MTYVELPAPEYRCSGDIPAGHVECDFECDTFEQAMDHFEATSHSVDQRCIAIDCEDPYHTATYSDIYPGEHTCEYTDNGADPTPEHPACGAPATVMNPRSHIWFDYEEWYCERHADPAWLRS